MPYSAVSPRRAKAVVMVASSAANRMSQNSAWIRPIPTVAPLSMAITGLGMAG
ncbi:hypothetical protein D3C78_1316820 [compost metagenome]